jgi:hypothetical protein
MCFRVSCLRFIHFILISTAYAFKIVFTFDVFFSAETTMHCKVTCILNKKQAHFRQLFCLQEQKLPDNREYIKIQEWFQKQSYVERNI